MPNDPNEYSSSNSNLGSGMDSDVNNDLLPLSDADDFEVANGHPDIRGWNVRTTDGEQLGRVKDLIVSTAEMRVRYVDIDVDESMRGAGQREDVRALLPIGMVDLDADDDDVIVRSSGLDFTTYPRYAGDSITRSYERTLRDRMRGGATGAMPPATVAPGMMGSGNIDLYEPGSAGFYNHEHFNDQQPYAKWRGTGPADTRTEPITRRTAAPGEQPTMEERAVDRAPVSDAAANTDPRERLSTEADNIRDFATGRRDGQSGLSNLGDPIKP